MTVPNVVAAIAMQVYEPVALGILKPDALGRAKRTQAGCRTHLRHKPQRRAEQVPRRKSQAASLAQAHVRAFNGLLTPKTSITSE